MRASAGSKAPPPCRRDFLQGELTALLTLIIYLREISGELESFAWKSAKCFEVLRWKRSAFSAHSRTKFVLRLQLPCSLRAFWWILGFDGTFPIRVFCSPIPFAPICPSLSQSFTVTLQPWDSSAAPTPPSPAEGLGPTCPAGVARAVWAEGEPPTQRTGFRC